MIPILAAIFFGLGLIIGSFLNVVIYRLNTDRTFGGRSACMSCQRQLSWYELVPVLSFAALRGRCLGCKTKISFQYPLVELAAGFMFSLLFLKFENAFFGSAPAFAAAFAFYGAVFSLLLITAAYDIRHTVIPDALAIVLGVLAFAGLFLFDASDPRLFFPHVPPLSHVLAGGALSVPFALLWLVSRGKWMGLGDAKLAVSLGWILGISGLLSAAVIAFWTGALAGIMLMALSKKYKMNSELPFGPYLVLGTFLSFLFELRIFYF